MANLDDQPFGVNNVDGSMGHKGETIKLDSRYDGPPAESKTFGGEKAHGCVSASQMGQSGRD
jgi:hypothetical protein